MRWNSDKTNAAKGLPLLACALAACGGEPMGDGPEAIGSTQEALSLTNATFVVDASMTDNEECRVPAAVYDDTNAMPYNNGGLKFHWREQLLIKRGTTLRGLCTVAVGDSGDNDFHVSQTLFNNRVKINLETNTATGVTVANEYAPGVAPGIAEPASSIEDARSNSSNKVKEYYHRSAQAKVVYTAIHPFEAHTFEQAEEIYNHNTSRNAIWVLGINNNNTSDDAKFHITATDILYASFPALSDPISNPFLYAVAFHGQDSCTGVDVQIGGNGANRDEFKQGVAEILTEAVPGISVAWSDSGGCTFSGLNQGNYVNWLGHGAGLQLEESSSLRNDAVKLQKVNDAVRSVYDCLLEDPDGYAVDDLVNGATVDTANTSYKTSGDCPRFMADIKVNQAPPAQNLRTWSAGVYNAADGDSAHIDIYITDWDGTRYRIGGGTLHYTVDTGGLVHIVKDTTGPNPWIEPIIVSGALYRAVIRASNSSGQAKGAFFSIN